MKARSISKQKTRFLAVCVILVGAILLLVQYLSTSHALPLLRPDFVESAPQGFGDRHNSFPWSMQWWNGKLYVGTNRAFGCFSAAGLDTVFPSLDLYPPRSPDVECPPNPEDLPLQAEIWRYTPETNTWERVYQSPNDVEIPGHPGKYTARDIGFRGMAVFTEPDGTEALYVGGVGTKSLWKEVPSPRILRSTDGVNFQAIPQDPGTLLGDIGKTYGGFRSLAVYDGRLYVIAGVIQGNGVVLEASDPAGGNDNFRQITPEGMQVFQITPFSGYLYVGTWYDDPNGYRVMRTDATGTPPYNFTPVVTNGGYRDSRPSQGVVSMHVLDGRLFVGTNRAAELIRVNPDDTWDLVVGAPRETPDGLKAPLSGLDDGFGWPFNISFWRMQGHEGVLYVGTSDTSTTLKDTPWGDEISDQMGFDLYGAMDGGWYLYEITHNGFGDVFNTGTRTFASTPYGLFLGTTNWYYGLQFWHGMVRHRLFLPLILRSGTGALTAQLPGTDVAAAQRSNGSTPILERRRRLQVEGQDGVAVLSWACPQRVSQFRIMRTTFTSNRQLQLADLNPETSRPSSSTDIGTVEWWIPGPCTQIGTTRGCYFRDTTTKPNHRYIYYIQAEDVKGNASKPSNIISFPLLTPVVTFNSLHNFVTTLGRKGKFRSQDAARDVYQGLADAHNRVKVGDLANALAVLSALHHKVKETEPTILDPLSAEDLEILLAKLVRRVELARDGLISPGSLN